MDGQQETALLAWGRTADGQCQLFTGEDIYDRAGRWGMARLKRDIPVIVTYCAKVRGRGQWLYFTWALALVPERAVPLGVRLPRPDEVDTLNPDGPRPWVLLAYKRPEDDYRSKT